MENRITDIEPQAQNGTQPHDTRPFAKTLARLIALEQERYIEAIKRAVQMGADDEGFGPGEQWAADLDNSQWIQR